MEDKNLQTLKEIQNMMLRSSRFISLSGLSGVSAGVCALVGAYMAHRSIAQYYLKYSRITHSPTALRDRLIIIGLVVFIVALVSAFIFTLRKSQRDNIPMWGTTSLRLIWNTFLPIGIGAILIFKLIELNLYSMVAPTCLLFYGLGLINGSKYTLSEVRFLGYAQIVLGVLNMWWLHYGLYFWALGFGVLHIIYGFVMWIKYERKQIEE